ncbi:MAG: hypothetical protein RLZZ150_1016 [Bacteroidota bacterium]
MTAYQIPRSRRLLDVVVFSSLLGIFWLAPNQDLLISIVATVPLSIGLYPQLRFLLTGNPAVVIADAETVTVRTAFRTHVFDRSTLRITCNDVPFVGATTFTDTRFRKTFTYGDVPRAALEVCGILPAARRHAQAL